MLHAANILICEDETLIALDLAISVEAAGGHVVGPAASVEEALMLLDERIVDAAILDVNLRDGDVTPVALRLLKLNVPLVLQSGVGLPDDLNFRAPAARLFLKPVPSAMLINELAGRLPQSPKPVNASGQTSRSNDAASSGPLGESMARLRRSR